MPVPVALITGPTSGLGAGFARRYAADGYRLVLVARDADRLEKLAEELRETSGCDAQIIVADLSLSPDRAKVADRLAQGDVQVLVNNAGFGDSGVFWAEDEMQLDAQLGVNVTAVMQLTRAAIPAMLAAQAGTVINVASISGLMPGRAATYSASKAWVIAFTEGLAKGLEGTGVGVHALAPGLIRTEFHERAGIEMSKSPSFLWLEVDQVVANTLAEVARGKFLIIPGWQYKMLAATARLMPRNMGRFVTKTLGKTLRRN